jgi:hypothetical protein
MIAALVFIALLDIGPLIGVGADADAILTLLAALIFVLVHGYIALGLRNIIAFSLITVAIIFVMGGPVVFALCRLFLDRTRAHP